MSAGAHEPSPRARDDASASSGSAKSWRCRACALPMLCAVRPLVCWFCGGANTATAVAPTPRTARRSPAAPIQRTNVAPDGSTVGSQDPTRLGGVVAGSVAGGADPDDEPELEPAPPPAFTWGNQVTAEVVERAPSGLPWFANVTSELPRRKLTMLGGRRGTGKTRLLLDVAAGVVRSLGRPVLFGLNDGMDAPAMVAAAEELGLHAELPRIAFVNGEELEQIADVWRTIAPALTVIDAFSNTTFGGEKCGERGDAQTAGIALVRRLAVEHDSASVLVMHMNSDGTFGGGAKVQQLSDVVVRLDRDELDPAKIILRIDDKNRHGPVDVCALLRMNGGRLEPLGVGRPRVVVSTGETPTP